MSADIFCMQEVEVASFEEEFAGFLADIGYGAVEPRDDKGKKAGKADQPNGASELAKCAIFFKTDRLALEWHEHRSRAVLAALRHIPTGRLLYVVSCHLEGAPAEAASRVSQTKSALERVRLDMQRRKLRPEDCCVVFAGDFNCDDQSAVCHMLRTGGLSTSFRDPWAPEAELTKADLTHEFLLRDLYEPAGPRGRLPTFCCPASKRFAAIDFMFYSPGTLRPVALRQPFTEEQAAATEGIGVPSEWHCSDHVPLGGVLAFRDGDEGVDTSLLIV